MHKEYEAIIGLEIHAQLNTKTKLFSSDSSHFGDEPNTNISPLSVALPGSLPVLNKEAVYKAISFGLAIGGKIETWSRFDRKSYFYPDCPRNYQITQYDHPLITGGVVTAVVHGEEKQFQVTKVQLEDDAGMLKHFSSFAGVDFNRSGVPLIEIISEPCMRSAQEASAYGMAIRGILDYLDASECNMEEGSLRIDVNVSVRKKGEKKLRNRIEIKNMNSFSNLETAIEHEIEKQIDAYEKNPDLDPSKVITQATYRFDPETGKTILMRIKEDADDYRYFPEPDLLPLVVSEAEIEKVRSSLPELPLQKYNRYRKDLLLSEQIALFLTGDKKLADYFEKVIATCPYPKIVANWIVVEFSGRLKEKGLSIYTSGIAPEHVSALVLLIQKEAITGKIAKSIADEMVVAPGSHPEEIIAKNPAYVPMSNVEHLREIVDQVIRENEQSVTDFRSGKEKAFGFLVGQVMKKTEGSATPQAVHDLLKKALS